MKYFQELVAEWMNSCFGAEIAADQLERADRFTEEALELAQTMPGFTAERAHALVDYVFGRPVGERTQEVGGVMVTLAALCNTAGVDIALEAARESVRIERPEIMAKIRAKQAAKPTGSALPIASEYGMAEKQSKADSFMEAVTNIAVGLGVSQAANLVVLPLVLHVEVSQGAALSLGVIYTGISLVRQYVLRRAFNGRSVWQAVKGWAT